MILKHRDKNILRFEWLEPYGVHVLEVFEENLKFLPLEMKGAATDDALWMWLKHRTVPKHRQNILAMFGRIGIPPDNLRAIVEFCKGLSLNDVHWVSDDKDRAKWSDVNLYDNPFSKTIAAMAFIGVEKPQKEEKELTTSPEFTTNGMLAKCWRRRDDGIFLYKSGTFGAGNTGFEPYSEYYAAQIAEALGLNHVSYGLEKFKGKLCSTCPLFTSDRYGYLPAGRIVDRDEALKDPLFADIFFFDALIFNTDRHMGNFGYLIDNDTNEIVGAAPIFDNGYGLFSLAMYRPGERYDEFDDLRKFVDHVAPALYDEWLGFPGGLTDEMRARLSTLKGFRFKHDRYYNLPTNRLRVIEDFLQNRISKILDYGERADEFLNLKQKEFTVNTVNSSSGLLQVVENLKADPFITLQELADILSVSKVTVSKWIGKLKDEGRVRRVGSDKTGYWEIL